MALIDGFLSGVAYLPLKLARNDLGHTITEADPATYIDRNVLSYLLEIQKPDYSGSSVFDRLALLEGREKPPYIQVGITIYEGATFSHINRLLDGLLTYKKPLPKQSTMSIAYGMTTPFLLREIIKATNTTIKDEPLTVEHAIKAGLSEVDYSFYGETFFSGIHAGKFLTWQPNEKVISKTQEEYLYFLLNFTPVPTRLKIRVKTTLRDGSEQVFTAIESSNIYALKLYQVICCPVGLSPLIESSNRPEGGTLGDVVKYDVWVANQDDARISEVRTYLVNAFFEAQERTLLISNSVGGFDTLRLTGEGNEALIVQRATAEIDPLTTTELAELKVISVKGHRSLVVSTGNFKKDTKKILRYYDELLFAEEVYLIDAKGHTPLSLQTSELVDVRDSAELTALQFQFRYSQTERNFSDLPAATSVQARATSWRGYGLFSCELNAYYRRTGNTIYTQIEQYYVDNNEAVRPRQIKMNLSDDPNFLLPLPDANCGSPMFLNVAISRASGFQKEGCSQPQVGNYPLIVVDAGRWGSEVSQAEADARAEAEWTALNTQSNANNLGICEIGAFVNVEIRAMGTKTRDNCAIGYIGTTAEIVVSAGIFSSNVSQAAADALAQSYWNSLDTKEYANMNGACVIQTAISEDFVIRTDYNGVGFAIAFKAPHTANAVATVTINNVVKVAEWNLYNTNIWSASFREADGFPKGDTPSRLDYTIAINYASEVGSRIERHILVPTSRLNYHDPSSIGVGIVSLRDTTVDFMAYSRDFIEDEVNEFSLDGITYVTGELPKWNYFATHSHLKFINVQRGEITVYCRQKTSGNVYTLLFNV